MINKDCLLTISDDDRMMILKEVARESGISLDLLYSLSHGFSEEALTVFTTNALNIPQQDMPQSKKNLKIAG